TLRRFENQKNSRRSSHSPQGKDILVQFGLETTPWCCSWPAPTPRDRRLGSDCPAPPWDRIPERCIHIPLNFRLSKNRCTERPAKYSLHGRNCSSRRKSARWRVPGSHYYWPAHRERIALAVGRRRRVPDQTGCIQKSRIAELM